MCLNKSQNKELKIKHTLKREMKKGEDKTLLL